MQQIAEYITRLVIMRLFYRILLVVLSGACVACQNNAQRTNTPNQTNSPHFEILQSDSCIQINVYSPWHQNIMGEYRITQPYQRIACTSATHVGFLNELGMTDKIVATCRPDRIYSLTQKQRQNIIDLGEDIRPNMEAIMLAQPDIVIISTYAEGDVVPAQIEALGIPVFYCNEWTESNPLARAEWIRCFGAILGCQPQADSIYQSVCNTYKSLIVSEVGNKSILSGMAFRGTWYVPSGNTFMGRLFRDAGANYHYANHKSNASIPLSMEQVINEFSNADVWVGCDALTLEELAGIDKKHTWFHAYQMGNVYHFRKRTLPSGANDFWESGVVHPERILSDLKNILQGDTSHLYYAAPLK